ncbi:MAG: hypothetical protein ACRDQZ_00295, partial [Mycobacteriales bacterium]
MDRATLANQASGVETVAIPPAAEVPLSVRLARWSRAAVRSESFLISIVSLVLAVAMTWPLALHIDNGFVHDNTDPAEYSWILSWPGHILFRHPTQLWQTNAFYPEPDSLAFTDTGLGYLPASFIGSGPIAAVVRFNVLLLLAYAMAFAGAYALARQLGSRWPGALLAGAAWAYAPWHIVQSGHITVTSTGGVAFALAALARGHGFSLREGYRPDKVRPGWVVAGWVIAAWQMTLGFATGVPFFYFLAALGGIVVVGWFVCRCPRLPRSMLWANLGGSLGFIGVTYFMARVSLRVADRYMVRRGHQELSWYSPRLSGLFAPPETSWLWGEPLRGFRLHAFAGVKGGNEVT